MVPGRVLWSKKLYRHVARTSVLIGVGGEFPVARMTPVSARVGRSLLPTRCADCATVIGLGSLCGKDSRRRFCASCLITSRPADMIVAS